MKVTKWQEGDMKGEVQVSGASDSVDPTDHQIAKQVAESIDDHWRRYSLVLTSTIWKSHQHPDSSLLTRF